MVRWYGYWNLLNCIAKLAPVDFFSGIIAGVGINILAALLITDQRDMPITTKSALCMSVAFIFAGISISIGRATLGQIRQIARPEGGEDEYVEYYERFRFACGIKGHACLFLFLGGVMLSILMVALMILLIGNVV